MAVRELITDAEFDLAFPLMNQLRPRLELARYRSLLVPMREQGYRMFVIEVEGRLVALAGVAVLTNLYDGRHLWVYDLVTDEAERSHGYGAQLLRWLEEFARDLGCERVSLSSGMARVAAHKFYEEKMGYQRPSYVFRKVL